MNALFDTLARSAGEVAANQVMLEELCRFVCNPLAREILSNASAALGVLSVLGLLSIFFTQDRAGRI